MLSTHTVLILWVSGGEQTFNLLNILNIVNFTKKGKKGYYLWIERIDLVVSVNLSIKKGM